MHNLYDYNLLVNDVFYRSEHILSYLERHHNLSPLDKEALSNTVLDALVSNNLINPQKQSLDLSSLCIVDNLEHKCYEPTPNITSIPLSIKEKMRSKCLYITGNVPISVFFSKPSGPIHYCIYDMNTALASLFPDFSFILCNYDSPTRKEKRATNRPFLEVEINGELYLVDALTKRIFKSSWFKKTYNLEVIEEVRKSQFNAHQNEIWQEQTAEKESYAIYLLMTQDIFPNMDQIPRFEETFYEIEKSKQYFPHSFVELEQLRKERDKHLTLLFPKNNN